MTTIDAAIHGVSDSRWIAMALGTRLTAAASARTAVSFTCGSESGAQHLDAVAFEIVERNGPSTHGEDECFGRATHERALAVGPLHVGRLEAQPGEPLLGREPGRSS